MTTNQERAAHNHTEKNARVSIRPCPQPRKTGYTTEQAAKNVLRRARKSRHRGKIPTRYYRCQCGKYHLTSNPAPLRKERT